MYFVHSRYCLQIEVIACVYWAFVSNARIVVIGLVAAIGYKAWLKTWWMFKRLCWYPWNKPDPALYVSNVRVQPIQCHNKDNLSYSIKDCKAKHQKNFCELLFFWTFFLKAMKDWFFCFTLTILLCPVHRFRCSLLILDSASWVISGLSDYVECGIISMPSHCRTQQG